MKTPRFCIVAALAAAPWLVAGCAQNNDVSYSGHVSSILQARCATCHLPGQEGADKSGFRVVSYETVMAGTRYGPVVVPGSSVSSTLYRLVSGQVDPSIRMPHGEDPLTEKQIDTIKLWIDQGANKG